MAIENHTFEKCFRDSFNSLTKYAYLYVRDTEQSREIVQTCFLKIWEKRRSLVIKTDLKIYLFQVIKNDCLNFLRSHRKIQFVQAIPEVAVSDEVEDTFPSIEKLNAHVNDLPSRCREIFILKKIHGLSYKEISLRLAISEKSVENQIGIALKKLRESLLPFNETNENVYE